MSAETIRVIGTVLASEIGAFERDIADTPPARSAIVPHALMGGDQREIWLAKLRTARAEIVAQSGK